MTYQAFIDHVKDYFGFGMNVFQSEVMMKFISQYEENKMLEGFNALVENCRSQPRVAHVKEAFKAAHILPREHTGDRGCERCDGTTWRYLTVRSPKDDFTYQAVETCSCTPRNLDPSQNPKWPYPDQGCGAVLEQLKEVKHEDKTQPSIVMEELS